MPTVAALAAFLPLSVVLFASLVPGLTHVLPWISHGAGHRSWWLNLPFLACRNVLGLMAVAVLGLILVRKSCRRGKHGPAGPSVVFILLYVAVLSVAAVDLVMSASPEWMNTLYPAHLFVGSFCLGLAAILTFSSFHFLLVPSLPRPGMNVSRDLANLTLGFALFTGYLFYTQVFVIWYGNIPSETAFLILRSDSAFWSSAGMGIVLFGFVIPLLVIPFGSLKRRAPFMALVGAVIMAGMWIEKFVLVMPGAAVDGGFPLGFVEIAVTAGFLGLAGLCALLIGPSLARKPEREPEQEERKGRET
jgi:Ni/Fe-hydrogenase subunit HybB-like protein